MSTDLELLKRGAQCRDKRLCFLLCHPRAFLEVGACTKYAVDCGAHHEAAGALLAGDVGERLGQFAEKLASDGVFGVWPGQG